MKTTMKTTIILFAAICCLAICSLQSNAQTIGCDSTSVLPCAGANKVFNPIMANAAVSTACTPVTIFTSLSSCGSSTTPGCDGTAGGTSELWFAVQGTPTATNLGINVAPLSIDTAAGSSYYKDLTVTLYMATQTTSGGCSFTATGFANVGSACSATNSIQTNFNITNTRDFTGGARPDSNFFVKITQATNAAADTARKLQICVWMYDPNKVNPCPSPYLKSCVLGTDVTFSTTTASSTDLTQNIAWGFDRDCDGKPDTSKNWCASDAVAIPINACDTSASNDIKCTSGNSKSVWTQFTYNDASILNYGSMLGFKVSGVGGSSAYAQVYDQGGCPIGGCVAASGQSYDMNLSSLGLTNGTKYYLRVWLVNVALNSAPPTPDLSCAMTNTYNDQYSNAAPLCTHAVGQTSITYASTNGATADLNTTTDCTLQKNNIGGVGLLSCNGNNVNTNDSWYKFCTGSTGGTMNLSLTYKNCAGTNGTQFWMFADGTAGGNDETAPNDFCDGGHSGVNSVPSGSTVEFANPLFCLSTGSTTVNPLVSSQTVSAFKCYYVLGDGYRADYCDITYQMQCQGCVMLPSTACWSDATPPFIQGGPIKVDTSQTMSTTTYRIRMSEPVRCCEIDATDFTLLQNGSVSPLPACSPDIVTAVGVACTFDNCGDYTQDIDVTLCAAPPVGYDSKWQIVSSGTTNIVDLCTNVTNTTPTEFAYIITPCTPPTCSATHVNETVAGACNGSINLTVSNCGTGCTYSWSTGAITEDISSLCAGSYTVTITNSTGCVIICDPAVDIDFTILPVELISFKGTYNESTDEVFLKWITASEKNIQSFSVEHSADGKEFKDIGRVAATGNTTTTHSYTLTDTKPYYPLSYYRLMASNVNGNISPVGDIIFVKTKATFRLTGIHPVPANDVLIMDFRAGPSDKLEVKIYDVVGKLLLTEKVNSKEGENSEKIDISSLSKGVYVINLMNDGHSVHQQKIVKY